MTRITMSAKDAAKYLGVSYWMLLELVKQKKIPCISVGNRKLFRSDTLDIWLSEKESSSLGESQPLNYGHLRRVRE